MQPFETIHRVGSAVLLTCEHASEQLPPEAQGLPAELAGTHRAYDRGAAALVRALASRLNASAVLAGFSRLWIDSNRDPKDPELIVAEIDGRVLSFNQGLVAPERQARLDRWHRPYHDAVDTLADPGLRLLLSVHSFTGSLNGRRREFDYGVLHDGETPAVRALYAGLGGRGARVRLNEPYSGFDGKIYSVAHHGSNLACPYVEIEVRDDLLDTGAGLNGVAAHVQKAVEQTLREL